MSECKIGGCNHPEGECLGFCINDSFLRRAPEKTSCPPASKMKSVSATKNELNAAWEESQRMSKLLEMPMPKVFRPALARGYKVNVPGFKVGFPEGFQECTACKHYEFLPDEWPQACETCMQPGTNWAPKIDKDARMQDLEIFFKLFKSYNPDLPMGPGMKANFIALRDSLEVSHDKTK